MVTKAVKISDDNYKWLCEVAGTLQAKEGSVKTMDDALNYVKKRLKSKLSDLAGAWRMTDKEAKEMEKSLKSGWRKWNVSV